MLLMEADFLDSHGSGGRYVISAAQTFFIFFFRKGCVSCSGSCQRMWLWILGELDSTVLDSGPKGHRNTRILHKAQDNGDSKSHDLQDSCACAVF